MPDVAITREQLLEAFKSNKLVWAGSLYMFWMHMTGKISMRCSAGCCAIEYEDLDAMLAKWALEDLAVFDK